MGWDRERGEPGAGMDKEHGAVHPRELEVLQGRKFPRESAELGWDPSPFPAPAALGLFLVGLLSLFPGSAECLGFVPGLFFVVMGKT